MSFQLSSKVEHRVNIKHIRLHFAYSKNKSPTNIISKNNK
ncbi:hypothetical protein Xentx_03552 [Xenorhabdus thuongxuanensis]|uniref:Uncharacterized protein n=1 Tax=Xenorhabdus thuongxuanensis TaxID=1873484 RepID=A0A1Q5TJ25_9GAMM|nr:hypothetical protein Xentx_03552 [Xenorhabdus thuongxuanensis]